MKPLAQEQIKKFLQLLLNNYITKNIDTPVEDLKKEFGEDWERIYNFLREGKSLTEQWVIKTDEDKCIRINNWKSADQILNFITLLDQDEYQKKQTKIQEKQGKIIKTQTLVITISVIIAMVVGGYNIFFQSEQSNFNERQIQIQEQQASLLEQVSIPNKADVSLNYLFTPLNKKDSSHVIEILFVNKGRLPSGNIYYGLYNTNNGLSKLGNINLSSGDYVKELVEFDSEEWPEGPNTINYFTRCDLCEPLTHHSSFTICISGEKWSYESCLAELLKN